MTFTASIRSCFAKYFQINGRARRSEYWWFYLFCSLVSILASMLDSALVTGAIFERVTAAALAIPSITVLARRLHDINRTSKWILIPIITAIIMFVVAYTSPSAGGDILRPIAFFMILYIIVMFIWTIKNGTSGTNRYGPDPLN